MFEFKKEKLPNYVLCAVIALAAFAVMQRLAINIWHVDLTRARHLAILGNMVAGGGVFFSAKYTALLLVISGVAILGAGLAAIAGNTDLSAFVPKSNDRDKPAEPATPPEVRPLAPEESEPVPQVALYPTHNHTSNMYNTAAAAPLPHGPRHPNEIPPEPRQVTGEHPAGDMAEKENLQRKIQEIMGKMKAMQGEGTASAATPAAGGRRILSPAKFDAAPGKTSGAKDAPVAATPMPKPVGYMNFSDIPATANDEFERTLIASGCKLLSEVRIGATGIDYIAVSADAINVVQAFARPGGWLASEDDLSGGEPAWFSEEGNALSPVARAIAAKRDVEGLLEGEVNLPVRAFACMTAGSVVNSLDAAAEWGRMGVKVIKLDSDAGEPRLASLGTTFPPGSQSELDEETMQRIISVLERAEMPE